MLPLPDRLVRMLHNIVMFSVALQPFVRPWPVLQFRNYFYTESRTPWTSD
jgi:hypothetical protein